MKPGRLSLVCGTAAVAALLPAALPAPAGAADPIMPLSEVRAGMRCTGLSVIRGTEISSFDVEIKDTIGAGLAARILIEVSGPAVDATGIGPGFSGSPIYCPGADGAQRNAGAVSEGLGEFGNKVALATPIELILAEQVNPPRASSRARRSASPVPGARPLAAPLTVSGLSPALARRFVAAGRRVRRPVLAAPAPPAVPRQQQGQPAAPLRPGSAVAVGLSQGAIALSAVGTVAYVDGLSTWLFAHPLDDSGARSLLLQDAVVHTVINNPVGLQNPLDPGAGLVTYKLATPGSDRGLVTNDGAAAVVGRLGALPQRTAVRMFAKDMDTGRGELVSGEVADESRLDNPPVGTSALSLIAPLALGEAAVRALGGIPTHTSASLCLRIVLRGLPEPIRFCNRYFDFAEIEDAIAALGAIDAYSFGVPRVLGVSAYLRVRRGLQQAVLLRATLPRRVRSGQTVRVRLVARRFRGRRIVRSFNMRIPHSVRPGMRTLTLEGPSATGGDDLDTILGAALQRQEQEAPEDGEEEPDLGPRTLEELAEAIEGFRRYDGVRARFSGDANASAAAAKRRPARRLNDGDEELIVLDSDEPEDEPEGTPVYRDPRFVLVGKVSRRVKITRP